MNKQRWQQLWRTIFFCWLIGFATLAQPALAQRPNYVAPNPGSGIFGACSEFVDPTIVCVESVSYYAGTAKKVLTYMADPNNAAQKVWMLATGATSATPKLDVTFDSNTDAAYGKTYRLNIVDLNDQNRSSMAFEVLIRGHKIPLVVTGAFDKSVITSSSIVGTDKFTIRALPARICYDDDLTDDIPEHDCTASWEATWSTDADLLAGQDKDGDGVKEYLLSAPCLDVLDGDSSGAGRQTMIVEANVQSIRLQSLGISQTLSLDFKIDNIADVNQVVTLDARVPHALMRNPACDWELIYPIGATARPVRFMMSDVTYTFGDSGEYEGYYDLDAFAQVTPAFFYISQKWQALSELVDTPITLSLYTTKSNPEESEATYYPCSDDASAPCIESIRYTSDAVATDKSKFTEMIWGYLPCSPEEIKDWCDEYYDNYDHCDPLNLTGCKPIRTEMWEYWSPEKRTSTSPYVMAELGNFEDGTVGKHRHLNLYDEWYPIDDEEGLFTARNDFIYEVIIRGDLIPIYNELDMRDFQLKALPADNGIPRFAVVGRPRIDCSYDDWCEAYWGYTYVTDAFLQQGIDVELDGTTDGYILSDPCYTKLTTAPRAPIIINPNYDASFMVTIGAGMTPAQIEYGAARMTSERMNFNALFPHAYWQGNECGWNLTYTPPTGTLVQPFTAIDGQLNREIFDPETFESTGFITRPLGLKASMNSVGVNFNLGWTVSITEDAEFMSMNIFAKQPSDKAAQSILWPTDSKYKNPISFVREGNTVTFPSTTEQGLPISWSSLANDVCSFTGTNLKSIGPRRDEFGAIVTTYCEFTATNLGSSTFLPLSETLTLEIIPKEDQYLPGYPSEILGTSTVTFPSKTDKGGTVTYTSLTTDYCTVSGNTVKGVSEGTCELEAKAPETPTGTDYYEVLYIYVLPRQTLTLDWIPDSSSLTDGQKMSLQELSNEGKKLTWSSSTPTICTISALQLTAVDPGECAFKASYGGDNGYEPFQAEFTLTIDPKEAQTLAVNFEPMIGLNSQSLPQKTDQNTKVNWFTLTPNVCSIVTTTVKGVDLSNADDIRECELRANAAEISTHAVYSETFVFDVEPRDLQIFTYSTTPITEGLSFSVPATSDDAIPLTWTSLTASKCTVKGTAITTVNAGDCGLRASNLGTANVLGYSEIFTVTVLPLTAQLLPASPVIPASLKGVATGALPAKTQQNATITWTSSTQSLCTVTGTTVRAVAVGTCTLMATAPKVPGQFTALIQTVNIDIVEGDPQALSATPSLPVNIAAYGSATLPTATQQGAVVSWTSTTTNICTVTSSKGVITVVGANANVGSQTCTIRATAPGINTFKPYQADFDVTVQPRAAQSLTVDTANLKGTNSRVLPTTTTVGSMSVTWSSTSSDSCTLSKNVVFGKAAGTCTVVASALGSLTHLPFNQSYDITIDPKDAQSLTVNTDNLKGTNTRALPTTTTTGSMPVTWSSSSTAVCKLTGNTLQGVAPGTCVVVAIAPSNNSFQSFTQSYNITIEGKDPQSLTVNTDNLKGTNTRALPTTTTTGSMPVTWSSTTTTFCKLTGNTLQGVAPGTCVVVANALGNNSYQSFAQSYSITIAAKDAQGISYSGTTTITGTQTLNLPPVTTPGNKTIVWKTTSASCTVTGNVVTGKAPATQSSCTVVGSALGDANWADLQAAAATLNILVKPRVAQTLIATPPATLAKLATTSLATNTAQGLAIVWKSNTTTICVVSGSTLTILNKSGTCTINAANAGNSVYAALSRNYNITVP